MRHHASACVSLKRWTPVESRLGTELKVQACRGYARLQGLRILPRQLRRDLLCSWLGILKTCIAMIVHQLQDFSLLSVGTRAARPHLLLLTAGTGQHLDKIPLPMPYPALVLSLQQALVQDKQDTASSAHHAPGPPKMVLFALTIELYSDTCIAMQEIFQSQGAHRQAPLAAQFDATMERGLPHPLCSCCMPARLPKRTIAPFCSCEQPGCDR